MSFHSTHATSHALQPMQVVVSISLQTLSSRCVPSPGTGPAWAEICWIRNVPRSLIKLPLKVRTFWYTDRSLEGARLQACRRRFCSLVSSRAQAAFFSPPEPRDPYIGLTIAVLRLREWLATRPHSLRS